MFWVSSSPQPASAPFPKHHFHYLLPFQTAAAPAGRLEFHKIALCKSPPNEFGTNMCGLTAGFAASGEMGSGAPFQTVLYVLHVIIVTSATSLFTPFRINILQFNPCVVYEVRFYGLFVGYLLISFVSTL